MSGFYFNYLENIFSQVKVTQIMHSGLKVKWLLTLFSREGVSLDCGPTVNKFNPIQPGLAGHR